MQKLNVLIFFISMLFVSCSNNDQNDLVDSEQEYIETTNLMDFIEKSNPKSTAKGSAGWPYTGCKEFTIKVGSDAIGGTVETKVNHCCNKGVCAAAPIWNLIIGIFGGNQTFFSDPTLKPVDVVESSLIPIGDYDVKVKETSYSLNEDGEIIDLLYVGHKVR
ncbi:hypothetical protein H7U19_00890 [Hyunsoonleella sp. SJ7]|uniref:Uncharacterized protein n=1 Tax=Hyunsoonleella aquatilis TaxID=2762758 RepID=A0A923KHM3_9FLAO|nr:hypothetical protein [Hyunsoonleella aquatilis]MBC3756939.1 hypothetical protein [Hyunsoonleella aquatilis]